MKKQKEFIHDDSNDIQKEHIDAFEKYAENYENEQELLLSLGSISLGSNGERQVVLKHGLKGSICPVTGLKYTSDISYPLYQNLIQEIKNRASRRYYAKKKQQEEYERMATGSGLGYKSDDLKDF